MSKIVIVDDYPQVVSYDSTLFNDIKIDNEIAEAEKEINILRKNAPDKINKIAIETSSELLQKLIGAEINNSSITAIVDDLSKRNGDKYYGN